MAKKRITFTLDADVIEQLNMMAVRLGHHSVSSCANQMLGGLIALYPLVKSVVDNIEETPEEDSHFVNSMFNALSDAEPQPWQETPDI